MSDVNANLENDKYVVQALTGLSDRTKENYKRYLKQWNTFLNMTPTQQIEKRIEDLTSKDLAQRNYFETKFREYKASLEDSGKLSAISVKTALIAVAAFFGRTVGKLNLKRGDWNSTLQTRIKNKLSLKLDDIKAMYAHANLRDRCLLLILAQSGFSEVDVSEFHIEDMKGFYESPVSLHYFIEKSREKTGETQATCLSFEAVHDLKDMLAERGNPKSGYLFTSQTKGKDIEGIDVRRIHEAMSSLAVKALGKERGEQFKTKQLRSFYNSALLRADIKNEVKDLLMGHQRLGARGHYGYDSETIIEAYTKAFEFLSINGMQSREDLAKLKSDLNSLIGKQQVEIEQGKVRAEQQEERAEKTEKELAVIKKEMANISKNLYKIIGGRAKQVHDDIEAAKQD